MTLHLYPVGVHVNEITARPRDAANIAEATGCVRTFRSRGDFDPILFYLYRTPDDCAGAFRAFKDKFSSAFDMPGRTFDYFVPDDKKA